MAITTVTGCSSKAVSSDGTFTPKAVSYTHLDVYKRQCLGCGGFHLGPEGWVSHGNGRGRGGGHSGCGADGSAHGVSLPAQGAAMCIRDSSTAVVVSALLSLPPQAVRLPAIIAAAIIAVMDFALVFFIIVFLL